MGQSMLTFLLLFFASSIVYLIQSVFWSDLKKKKKKNSQEMEINKDASVITNANLQRIDGNLINSNIELVIRTHTRIQTVF